MMEPLPHEPVPLFLSTTRKSPTSSFPNTPSRRAAQSEESAGVAHRDRLSWRCRRYAAVLALFSIDSTRAVIVNAKASLGGGAPVQFGAAQQRAAQASAPPPPRVAAPASPEPAAADRTRQRLAAIRPAVTTANALASASPSRDEIAAAYQSAIKGRVAVTEPVAREAAREAAPVVPAVRGPQPPPREAAPARRIDPDELAALLKRAKGLLAIGDITSARLLLERAADAQEAGGRADAGGDL